MAVYPARGLVFQMNELELLNKYEYSSYQLEGIFDTVSQAICTNNTLVLKINECREKVNEIFNYLEIRERFRALAKKSDRKLSFTSTHFELYQHKFETLDEVEKAINIKVFL